ncbi:MAG: argininosuccinate lyase [Rickettsiales bacterium]|nr:argininosuccinate lyase [Rickettsiales bacterium]|tara:strand:+ start:515 stop:1909 length:1395 start_codon:yes stop_codon:yes gene_type:complete
MKKKTNPLWGGRFKQKSSEILKKINNSISFDYKLATQDLSVSKAYCKALCKSKIISKREEILIVDCLKKIENDILDKKLKFNEDYEDIHMNIEMELKKRIGTVAGKLHTGRSRNDQVATDLKIWIKEKTLFILNLLKKLQEVLVKKSEENIFTIMPGFTHLQNAQPISLAHYFMAFFEMFERDKGRFLDMINRLDECPLGSGALAGTNFYKIDRKYLAKLLGFRKPTENSLDSVSDRDYAIEFLSNLSILAVHFSRIAEDFIIWCSDEFSFIKFSDLHCTGSSIMPQKKNPDAVELVRSKASRVFGNLLSLLTTLKGLPMTYSKDLQEDKEPVFDSCDTMEIVILIMTELLNEIIINKEKMIKSSKNGYSTATDLADWLVQNTKLTFRDAHHMTGKIVLLAEQKGCNLDELDITDLKKIEPEINNQIFGYISVKNSVKNKSSYGGTGFKKIKEAIQRAKKKIKK